MGKWMQVLALVALAASGCKRISEPGAQGVAANAAPPTPVPAPTPAAPVYVHIVGTHTPGKPTDPVVVDIPAFRVVSASFANPRDLTGATANLELDLSSLKSDDPGRDDDLKSASWFDTGAHRTLSVAVHDVKKSAAADHYTAQAEVQIRGITRSMPVEFEVLEALPSGAVRIKGAHRFSRLQFPIGSPNGESGNPTSNDVTVELALEIPKS